MVEIEKSGRTTEEAACMLIWYGANGVAYTRDYILENNLPNKVSIDRKKKIANIFGFWEVNTKYANDNFRKILIVFFKKT